MKFGQAARLLFSRKSIAIPFRIHRRICHSNVNSISEWGMVFSEKFGCPLQVRRNHRMDSDHSSTHVPVSGVISKMDAAIHLPQVNALLRCCLESRYPRKIRTISRRCGHIGSRLFQIPLTAGSFKPFLCRESAPRVILQFNIRTKLSNSRMAR